MKTSISFVLAPLSLLVVACSGGDGKVDLGNNQSKPVAQGLAAYEGSWDGHVELLKFKSGSDHLRLVLDDAGHGSLTVGDGELVPQTDPDLAPYPWDSLTGLDVAVEGFAYAVRDAHLENRRIQLEIDESDLTASWCAVQTPRPTMPGVGAPPYAIDETPSSYSSESQPGEAQGDNVRDIFATDCTCTATSCTGASAVVGRLDAVISDDGTKVTGTVALMLGNNEQHATVVLSATP